MHSPGALQWDCIYTPNSDPRDFTQDKTSHRFKRSRKGCWTCRFRRKKCDEHRPVCDACVRNKLLCSWPTGEPSLATENASCASPPAASEADMEEPLASTSGSTSARRAISRDLSGGLISLVDVYMGLETLPALRRDQLGRSLLQHYTDSTSSYLTVGTSQAPNPFLTLVLPLAHEFDDVLHIVLALSGSHLSFTNPSYAVVSHSHYAVALRAVKHRITLAAQGKKHDILHLLVLLLLLCQFEGVDGNMSGAVLPHLAAIDSLLLMIQDSLQSTDEQLVGFILESYFYFKTIAYNVGFDVSSLERNLDALDRLSNASSRMLLAQSSVFGFLFGKSFELFSLIPEVAQLAYRQPSQSTGLRHTDPELLEEFDRLEHLILAWCPDAPQDTLADYDRGGLLQQHALLIFLRVALYGPGQPVDFMANQIDKIANEFITLLRTLTTHNLAWTNLLWATSITGSCLQRPEDRDFLAFTLETQEHQMNTCLRVLQILRWVWEYSESDPEAYGPHGINKVCQRHGVKISIG